nr:hypothetical protein [Nitrosomonas nitrosa]
MATFINLPPESQRDVYLPGETLRFVFPGSGVVQGGTVRLRARVRLGAPAGPDVAETGATAIGANEANLSRFGGVWGCIKRIDVMAPALGTIDTLEYANRTASTVKAFRSDAGLEMSIQSGALEYSAPNLLLAENIVVGKQTRVLGLAAAIDLTMGLPTLFAQNIDLSQLGGLVVEVTLAQNSECLRSSNAAATYNWVDVAMEAKVGMVKPQNPLSYLQISTLTGQLDTGRKTLQFNSVAQSACVGVIVTFNTQANLATLANDEFAMVRPTDISEVVVRISGSNMPLAYPITVVNAGGAGEDNNELIANAAALLGSKLPNNTLANSVVVNGNLVGDMDASSRPTVFAIGLPFTQPTDLRRSPVSIDITSGATAAAPFTAFLHFIGQV